jgi:hypothetical protein
MNKICIICSSGVTDWLWGLPLYRVVCRGRMSGVFGWFRVADWIIKYCCRGKYKHGGVPIALTPLLGKTQTLNRERRNLVGSLVENG